jgi:phasin family protein
MKPKTTEAPATGDKESPAANAQVIEAIPANAPKAIAAPEAAPRKMKEDMEKAMKTAEEFVAFSQGNFEALIKSGQIWAAGVQDLSKQIATVTQASFEEGFSTLKALTGVKSLKDALDLQAAFTRSAVEKTLAESGKLTDASFKLTEQALAPLTARVTIAVEKFAKAA